MLRISGLVVVITTLISLSQLHAQDKNPVKFGKVSVQDFDLSALKVDTTLGAVIISDVGTSDFEGNSKGWFSIIHKRQKRIKITNKNGLELADVQILLYKSRTSDNEEVLSKLKASTYNLENGQVVETKLKDDAIFKDKYDKNYFVKKFTMPVVKEGSIIEYSYTITSDFLFNLQPWNFQDEYPIVWSEYRTDIPQFFEYVMLSQGYNPFYIKDNSTRGNSYQVRIPGNASERDEVISLSGNSTESRWVMRDVPALKEEKYTTSIKNHISRIEFQLSATQFPNQVRKEVMSTWPKACEDLMEREDFGTSLTKNNNWLDGDMKAIVSGATTEEEKAKKIYYYVKDNIKCTGSKGITTDKSIKQVFKDKNGSVPEVNLLLTAMMRHENIKANPVILSTTRHGKTQEMYPLMDKFNYVICDVAIDTNNYYLDASESYLGFNRLPSYCYNGAAREISTTSPPLYFMADGLEESKYTNIILFNDDSIPGKWSGSVSSTLSYDESCDVREKIKESGKEGFEKKLTATYGNDYKISDVELNDLNDCEKSIKLNYGLTIEGDGKSDIIYLSPMIKEGYSENYFKSADRKYPVEMPSLTDETYNLYIDIPAGYEVDEIPKSMKALLNEDEGLFEFIVNKDAEKISLRSHIKLVKATFPQESYQTLRDFFAMIVKKHSEQIVFKKKK